LFNQDLAAGITQTPLYLAFRRYGKQRLQTEKYRNQKKGGIAVLAQSVVAKLQKQHPFAFTAISEIIELFLSLLHN